MLLCGLTTKTVSKSSSSSITISYGISFINKPVIFGCVKESFANAGCGINDTSITQIILSYNNASTSSRTIITRWYALGEVTS